MDLLAAVPGVTHRQLLYPAAIAVKIEASVECITPLEQQLQLLEGVVSTRLYRAKNNT